MPNSTLGKYSQSFQRILLGNNAQLGGPLPSLTGLPNLRELGLGLTGVFGTLSALADNFADLDRLEVLDLRSTTGLTGEIPSDISLLTSLKVFTIGSTLVEGPIPDSIGEFISLGKATSLFLMKLFTNHVLNFLTRC